MVETGIKSGAEASIIVGAPAAEATSGDRNEPSIVSESRNFTVYSNETVHLACMVHKGANTIAIWNQCEDPNCRHLRNPITIGKDNFIQDLRFRVLSELPADAILGPAHHHASNHYAHHHHNQHDENDFDLDSDVSPTVKRDQTGASTLLGDQATAWTLEIRKFSKADEGCYQCQLNSFGDKNIHYCLKLQSKKFFIFMLFIYWDKY